MNMIEQHKARPYIENLRNDPRTRALFDGWVAQACMAVEQRLSERQQHESPRRAMHEVAQEAIALAMAFVLDNDGEYQMVCEERDRLRDQIISAALLTPPSAIAFTKADASGI